MFTGQRRRAGAVTTVALVAVAALLAAFWQTVARTGIVTALAWAGFHVSFAHLDVHGGRLVANGVDVRNLRGEPIADIGRLELRYSLRDLLPGSSRMYGLSGFDIENAHVVVVRHKDGTLNIPVPANATGPPASAPYVFTGRVRNASVDVYDLAQGSGPSHHLIVKDVYADLDVATDARTRYRARLTYVEDGQRYPVYGNGDVDVAAGIGVQHWRAARVPIGRIVNVALNSAAFRVLDGSLREVDARIVALPDAGGTLAEHMSATATIDRARIAIGGLSKPLRNVNGALALYGDGLLLEDVNATLADMPIQLGGGVFGLASPRARLTVTGRGDLGTVRAALAQTARLPLSGHARLDAVVEGAAAKPLVLIALRSPRAAYATYAFGATDALVAFDGSATDVVGFRTRYGNIALYAGGRLAVRPQRNGVEMLAAFDAPSHALPYVDAVTPGVALHGTMVATGERPTALSTHGVVFGDGADRRLAAAFALRSDGTGTIGPLRIGGVRESLYAVAGIDHPHDTVDAYVDATNVRVQTASNPLLPGLRLPAPPGFAATIDARVLGRLHAARLQLAGSTELRNVRTPLVSVAQTDVRFGSTPRSGLAIDADARGIGTLGAVATAMLSFQHGTLRVNDAAAAMRGTFADARGNVTNLLRGEPHYDFSANVHSADLASLAAIAQPRAGGLVEGSAEARFHVFGSGALPEIEGNAQLPEGAVNGLAFHDLNATVRGTPASIELGGGRVGVGSTLLAFNATLGAASQRVSVDAPHADLADFNDFFDAGDVLGGKGSIRAGIALAGGAVTATSGDVALHDAKVRSFDVGAADANWHGSGDRIATTLAFGGPFGRVSASGTVALSGSVDVTARARDVDLSQWLPMAGIVAPVTGLAQADLAVRGRYPNWDSTVTARVTHASAGRMPVTRFAIAANTVQGRGRVTGATLEVPNAVVDGSGTFGLRPADRLGLVFHASTPDVAAVAKTLTGKTFDAAGALTTTVRLSGTLLHPAVDDEFTLAQARYAQFDVPRAVGRIHADERTVAISSGEIDLRKGRVLVQGNLPIRLRPFQIDPQNRPVNAAVVLEDVEASNVAAMLPKGTVAGGRIDGRMTLGGTVRSPAFAGAVALDKGYFSGPQERVPISGATARLVLNGTTVRLQDARANAGGGTLEAGGLVSIPDVRDVDRVAVALNVRARDARIDLPQYVKGRFNGDVSLTRAAASRSELAGTVSIDAARIPLTALYDPKPSNSPGATLPDLGMDLRVSVNRDVRVVSPNVDVGTQGAVHATGTLAAPQLAGTFTSTGGTVNFFRNFVVEDATVSFDPSSGIVPDVDASATTFVTNPDTNVALRVTGPATHLNLGLASDPSYDREQILGLLIGAQSFGAVRGVQSSGGSPFSTSSAVSNLAGGQLNELFTRNLLEPLSVALSGTLGLQNLQITNDLQSGLGVNAVKAFGKNVSFVFSDTFNEPRRQSWSLQAHPSNRTQFELTAYSSQGTTLGYRPFLVQQLDMGSAATIPLDTGANGIDVKVKRSFP